MSFVSESGDRERELAMAMEEKWYPKEKERDSPFYSTCVDRRKSITPSCRQLGPASW